ncbi:MAG: hypothetical protein RLZZ406_450, partial [Pseudomonadota bacterium]
PMVSVAAPTVNVTPQIQLAQPHNRWRFTVTRRDNTSTAGVTDLPIVQDELI